MLSLFYKPQKRNNFEPYLIRPLTILLYTVLLLAMNLFFEPPSEIVAGNITTQNLINLVNQDREKYGLNHLKADVNLTSAAHAKANDILQHQYWDHYGPDGQTPWQFMTGAGYDYYYAGENLAKGFKTAEGVHQGLMNSPTHRDNILSDQYVDIGIAVVEGNLLGDDVYLVVQMFGSRSARAIASGDPEVVRGVSGQGSSTVIKSIRITYPEQDEYVGQNKVTVKGAVEPLLQDSRIDDTVNIYLDDEELGKIDITDLDWEYSIEQILSQGNRKLSVKGAQAQDEVSFIVDTVAPQIFVNRIELVGDTLLLEFSSDEPDLSMKLVADSIVRTAQINDYGLYEFVMGVEDELGGKQSVIIVASDLAGNISELDVYKEVQAEIFKDSNIEGQSNINSLLGGLFQSGGSLPTGKELINLMFIIFIIILLAVEIYYYNKKRMLMQKGHLLSTVFIWRVILVLGYVVGIDGSLAAGITKLR